MIKVLTKNKPNKAKINILAFSASCHANHPSKQGTNCQKNDNDKSFDQK